MLLYVHKDIELNIDAIIHSYSRKYPRSRVAAISVSRNAIYISRLNPCIAYSFREIKLLRMSTKIINLQL